MIQAKLSAVRNWHAPDKVKAVRQFVGFVGYCVSCFADSYLSTELE